MGVPGVSTPSESDEEEPSEEAAVEFWRMGKGEAGQGYFRLRGRWEHSSRGSNELVVFPAALRVLEEAGERQREVVRRQEPVECLIGIAGNHASWSHPLLSGPCDDLHRDPIWFRFVLLTLQQQCRRLAEGERGQRQRLNER
jgi:hypothetical protein